jgi:uncharacterized protein YgfB (UPF0149 family)
MTEEVHDRTQPIAQWMNALMIGAGVTIPARVPVLVHPADVAAFHGFCCR